MATTEGQYDQDDGHTGGYNDEAGQLPSRLDPEIQQEDLVQPGSAKEIFDSRVEDMRTEKLHKLANYVRNLPLGSGSDQEGNLNHLLSDLNAETLDKPTGTLKYTVLHIAAKRNLPHAALMFLKKGASSETLSAKSRSPLQVACRNGNQAVAKVLIGAGADVNRAKPTSPLMYACKYGFNDLIGLLLSANADLGAVDRKQWNALHFACWFGQETAASILLAHCKQGLDDKDATHGLTPLGMAVKEGHQEVVEVLLRYKDAESKPADGLKETAGVTGNLKSTPELSAIGDHVRADLEVTDKQGLTMLVVAAQAGHTGIFGALIKAGAACDVTCGEFEETALMYACRYGHLDIARELFDLRGNESIDMADKSNETALHKAVSIGHVELVELLIKNNAKIDLRDKFGYAPLHRACEQGLLEVVQKLLSHGAKATARNSSKMNSLHIACSSSAQGKLHKRSRAPTTKLDDSNDRANMQTAVSSEAFGNIIMALSSKGCNPFLRDNAKLTAFHYAFPGNGEQTTLTFLVSAVERHYFTEADREQAAEDDVLLWATKKEERHEIVKLILSQRQSWGGSSHQTPPRESVDWNIIEWATFRGYPSVLLPLLALAARSAGPRTLDRALSIAESALEKFKQQSKRNMGGEVASHSGPMGPERGSIEVDRYAVRDLLPYPLFTRFSTQEIELEAPISIKDPQGLLEAWTASIIQFRATQDGASSFLRRDRSVRDVIYGEGPSKIISDEKNNIDKLIDQLKTTPEAEKALREQSIYLDRSGSDATFSWIHLPANNMVWMSHLLQKIVYEDLQSENDQKNSQDSTPLSGDSTSQTASGVLRLPKTQKGKDFQEMSYFLNDSWSQIPDGVSRFRIMRPCFVKSSKESSSKPPTPKPSKSSSEDHRGEISGSNIQGGGRGSPKAIKGGARGAMPRSTPLRREDSGSADVASKDEPGTPTRIPPFCQPSQTIQAIYLPYLVFSKYHKDEASMSRQERSKMTFENPIQGKDVPSRGGNESDDWGPESVNGPEDGVELKVPAEKRHGARDNCSREDVSVTPKREATQWRWNILRERAKMHDDMAKAYSNDVVHQCSTLDESFYHFEEDNEDAENDRRYRNATQIVTKNAKKSRRNKKHDSDSREHGPRISASSHSSEVGEWERGKGEDGAKVRVTSIISREHIPNEEVLTLGEETASGRESLVQNPMRSIPSATGSANADFDEVTDEDLQWPILRVNQLWAWVISDNWLITCTTDPLDDAERPFITGFLGHLNKQAAAGRMHSQPRTTFDISRALVDYCIGAYDRIPEGLTPEGGNKRSIGQIFSQSINDIATEETKLYKRFKSQKNADDGVMRSRWLPGSSRERTQQIEDNMWRAISLSHELRDVKDELNILATIAKYQHVVQKDQRKGGPLQAEKSAVHVVDDINKMEKMADRLQSSIDTTLTLEQNEISIAEAQETVRQGKILMLFTLITIIFLPLSFLATFFAIDFSEFLKTPGWVHVVIFCGSFTFSTVFLGVAYQWDQIRTKRQKRTRRSEQGRSLSHQPEPASGTRAHDAMKAVGGRLGDVRGGIRRRLRRKRDMDKSSSIC